MTALLYAPSIWALIGIVYGGLAVACWCEGRKNRTLTTYTLPNGDGTFTDITPADRDALLAQGWHEIEVAALLPTSDLTERGAR
tara:strand:+ start:5215 stop:5466 length:252 start_codon:yes stop_codon:yes gene_type:complete